jgi:hypothetical protein
MFAIGTLLVFVVRFGHGGMLGLCRGVLATARRLVTPGSDKP